MTGDEVKLQEELKEGDMVSVLSKEPKAIVVKVPDNKWELSRGQHAETQPDINTLGPIQAKLQQMLAEFDVESEVVHKWVSKAKCSDIGGLSDEQAQKCITFIEKNYDQKTKLLKK